MVKLAVAGGTGTAGQMVVAESVRRDYETRSLSRHTPATDDPARVAGAEYLVADAGSSQGLAEALAGVDVLIETLDGKAGAALQAMPNTTRTLLNAAEAAGVKRAVLLSIVNSDQSDYGYYQVQAQRAELYRRAGLATTVVYATQFHDLIASIYSAGAKVGLIPAFSRVSFQPIATADAARALLDAAVAEEPPETVTVGGPQVLTMRQLAQQWRTVRRSKALIVPMPLPGSFGKFLRDGRNLVPEHAYGTVTFSDWLESSQAPHQRGPWHR